MGIKISELPQTTQLTDNDVFPIVQSGDTKKIQAKNIITNSHNTNQTNTYSSDYINNNFNVEGSTGYTKFPDGTLICYGVLENDTYSNGWTQKNIPLSKNYIDTNYTVLISKRAGGTNWTSTIDRGISDTTSQAKIEIYNSNSDAATLSLNWCTIGRWK